MPWLPLHVGTDKPIFSCVFQTYSAMDHDNDLDAYLSSLLARTDDLLGQEYVTNALSLRWLSKLMFLR